MSRTKRKIKLFFVSILCFLLGSVIGFVGNIFLTLPASFVIEKTREDVSHVDSYQKPDKVANSTTTEHGSHIIENSDLTIHFLELGNRNTGDCIYIKVKNGENDTDILVDAGSKSTSIPYIEEYIDTYLTDNVLDFVIITHAHEDHYAGFATHSNSESLFDHYRTNGNSIETIITFAQTNKKDTATMHKNYLRELSEATASGAKHFTALECSNESTNYQGYEATNIYTLGTDSNGDPIKMYILYQKYYVERSTTENNYSVCFQIVQGSGSNVKKYLFTGDLEAEGEESLVDDPRNSGLLSQVELYKAGHHGSKTSSSQKLMSVIQPKNVVVCCCAGSSEYTTKNENQFPTQEFVNNVTPYTDKIYVTTLCTDYNANKFESFNGNITICSTGTGSITVICSNNTTLLQDTEWFKKNRTLPQNAFRS